jgi:hypothetical protein
MDEEKLGKFTDRIMSEIYRWKMISGDFIN